MCYLFYGDYIGSLGILLIFFEVFCIGLSYNECVFFGNIIFGILKGISFYWKKRLNDFVIFF